MSEYINAKAERFYGDRDFKSGILPKGCFPSGCPRDMLGSMGVAIPKNASGKPMFAMLSK